MRVLLKWEFNMKRMIHNNDISAFGKTERCLSVQRSDLVQCRHRRRRCPRLSIEFKINWRPFLEEDKFEMVSRSSVFMAINLICCKLIFSQSRTCIPNSHPHFRLLIFIILHGLTRLCRSKLVKGSLVHCKYVSMLHENLAKKVKLWYICHVHVCTYILRGVCHMVGLHSNDDGTGQGYLNEYHWKPFQLVLGKQWEYNFHTFCTTATS